VAAWSVLSCSNDPDTCEDVAKGDRLTITILEPFDSNSKFKGAVVAPSTCHEPLGLVAGAELRAIVTGFVGDSCLSGLAEFEDLGEWQWQAQTAQPGVSGAFVLYGPHQLTRESCTGDAFVRLKSRTGVPTREPEPGATPPAVLQLGFAADPGDDPECPVDCYMEFAVTIAKN
jgi:hypothetical protein